RRYLQQVRQQPPRELSLAIQPPRRRGLELLELSLGPIGLVVASGGFLLLKGFLRLQQAKIACVFGNRVVLLLPAENLDVVFMGKSIDVTTGVELRPAGAAKDLLRRAGVHQLLLARRTFYQ